MLVLLLVNCFHHSIKLTNSKSTGTSKSSCRQNCVNLIYKNNPNRNHLLCNNIYTYTDGNNYLCLHDTYECCTNEDVYRYILTIIARYSHIAELILTELIDNSNAVTTVTSFEHSGKVVECANVNVEWLFHSRISISQIQIAQMHGIQSGCASNIKQVIFTFSFFFFFFFFCDLYSVKQQVISLCKKATIHHVATMLAISLLVLR